MWKNVGQEKIHRIEGKSMKDDPNPMDSKKRRGTEKISRNFCVNFEFFFCFRILESGLSKCQQGPIPWFTLFSWWNYNSHYFLCHEGKYYIWSSDNSTKKHLRLLVVRTQISLGRNCF